MRKETADLQNVAISVVVVRCQASGTTLATVSLSDHFAVYVADQQCL